MRLPSLLHSSPFAHNKALSDEYMLYCVQMVKNAKAMANALMEKKYKIISGGTDNHCMLIDLRSKNITGKEAEKALGEANITVNKNMVPFDDKSPFVTSGIRIGTPAVTSRGLKEKDCIKLVEFVDAALMNKDNAKELAKIKKKVNTMMSKYPLFAQ